eukprot:4117923-Pyramimonas_sp.AAC.1
MWREIARRGFQSLADVAATFVSLALSGRPFGRAAKRGPPTNAGAHLHGQPTPPHLCGFAADPAPRPTWKAPGATMRHPQSHDARSALHCATRTRPLRFRYM